MAQPEPQQSTDNPITFLVAAAGHTHDIERISWEVSARSHSQITPSFIADEVNREHSAMCACSWRGSRNCIYAYREDTSDFATSGRLRGMSPTDPRIARALIPSQEDWALAPGFTASLPPHHSHFVICPEPNELKRKASLSPHEEQSSTPKQSKLADGSQAQVSEFIAWKIFTIGAKSTPPRQCIFVPTELYAAFRPTKRRLVFADATNIIASAFKLAGDTIGWGFYASSESLLDFRFHRSSFLAFFDVHKKFASEFRRMFGPSAVGAWMEATANFELHSRSFIFFFAFNDIAPLDVSIRTFEASVEQAVYTGVKAAAIKYKDFPGMESLGEIIVGCKGSEALRRVLYHIAEKRSSGAFDIDIVIMVEAYDDAARIAQCNDMTGATTNHVPLGVVTNVFKTCFYSPLSMLDPVDNRPIIQRLILQGNSPAFSENLRLSLPLKDLSGIPGVPGLTIGQIKAQLAVIFGVDGVADPRIQQAITALQRSCPGYSYTDNHMMGLITHVPRKYLTAFFSTFAENPNATSLDIKKALTLHRVKSSSMPEHVLAAATQLYGRGVRFWEHTATSDLLNERLGVRVAQGFRLRLSYRDLPKDVVTADSSREITEITPLHVAQFLFEEGALTWDIDSNRRCFYKFPSPALKIQFVRNVVERSLLKTYKFPARYKEPADVWLKAVLTKHFKNRPLASVVHIVENVPQTALDIITEMSLATSGEVYGYSFMELQTQSGSRIDNAMFIFEGQKQRPRASLWELKSIPVGDILEATMCRTLDRQSNKSVEHSAFPEIDAFMKHLHAFPESEWDAPDYTSDRRRWPTAPDSLAKDWVPTKLKDLFYWGYDNSDPKRKGRRVRYSIYNVIYVSDRQIGRYGREVARDSVPPVQNSPSDFPDIGGLRDDRVLALPASPTVDDTINLGTVILLAGRFIITRNVGSVNTRREFRVVDVTPPGST